MDSFQLFCSTNVWMDQMQKTVMGHWSNLCETHQLHPVKLQVQVCGVYSRFIIFSPFRTQTKFWILKQSMQEMVEH